MEGVIGSSQKTFALPVDAAVARATMRSHGWFDLLPFRYCPQSHSLRYCGRANGQLVAFTVRARGSRVSVAVHRGPVDSAKTLAARILALDWDIKAFHESIRSYPELQWIKDAGHGRQLRSASLFEDVLKVLFTTNTTWERTKAMNDRLVSLYGKVHGSERSYPSPQALVDLTEQQVRESIGSGYRSSAVIAIAENALRNPGIFLEDEWQTLSPQEFRGAVGACHGIGPVSADYLCRVYGRSQGLAVDAYVRRRISEMWKIGGDRIEAKLSRMLRGYGANGPLVLWLTITRDWHDAPEIIF